jgi:hypothetical protein
VQFEWDPQKAAANVKRRRITFDEAASVLEDPLSTTYPDEAHSEEETRFLTIGASPRGRVLVVAHTERNETIRIISARRATGPNEISMSKANRPEDDDLRPEYDFASMKGGIRGKYVARLRKGSNLVLLEPEAAAAFPSAEAVNEALRGVLNTTRAVRGKGGLPNKALQPTSRGARRGKFGKRAGAARG